MQVGVELPRTSAVALKWVHVHEAIMDTFLPAATQLLKDWEMVLLDSPCYIVRTLACIYGP